MTYFYSQPISHHGILGMKWGVRCYQNTDGTLTEEGKKRYGDSEPGEKKKMSTGKKVAIGVGIAAGAAAVAGAAALIATGKYKEIPDLINRGKEKVQMALIKAGKGDLVYGKEEWENQVAAAELFKNKHFGTLADPATGGHLRRIQNNSEEVFRRNEQLLRKAGLTTDTSGIRKVLSNPANKYRGMSALAEASDKTKNQYKGTLAQNLIRKEVSDSIKKTTL